MISRKNIFVIALSSLLLIWFFNFTFIPHKEGCKGDSQDNEETSAVFPRPKLADNKVVAHRGGSKEISCPDNSIEALNYAIELGCYASECDVYITKDNQVVVAHADSEDKINGLNPWRATYAQIDAAGKLTNGESIPLLEDYLDRVLDIGTILLWIDIKTIKSLPRNESNEYSSLCAERASEIVREKGAKHFVEFIVAREDVLKRTLAASRGDWPCGYMNTTIPPSGFHQNGCSWANFSLSSIFYHNGDTKGDYTIDDYTSADIRVSIYNVDSEMDREWYTANKDKLYALTTNYPKALLDAINNK